MELLARNYAEGLFLLAKEEDKVIAYQNEFKLISEAFTLNPELLTFLKQYQIKRFEKLELIEKVFGSYLSKTVLNFLKLLIDKEKTKYIFDISSSFNTFCNKYQGIDEGVIYSTIKLSEAEILNVENSVSKKLNKKIQLKNVIDMKIIGGIKVAINDQILDNSIKGRIEDLGSKILKEKR